MSDTKDPVTVETVPTPALDPDAKQPIVSSSPSAGALSPAEVSSVDNGEGTSHGATHSSHARNDGEEEEDTSEEVPADEIDGSKKGFFAYFLTKDFYIILFLGY
jgi:hypothetical protein